MNNATFTHYDLAGGVHSTLDASGHPDAFRVDRTRSRDAPSGVYAQRTDAGLLPLELSIDMKLPFPSELAIKEKAWGDDPCIELATLAHDTI